MSSKFPKIDGGFCDGLGCGWSEEECFCTQYVKMKEEYQEKFDRQWRNSWEDKHCKEYEDWWRKEVWATRKNNHE